MPTTCTFQIRPNGPANIGVAVPASATTDLAGNGNVAASATSIYQDVSTPTPTITSPPSHDGSTPFQVTITFDEPVTGLVMSDLSVTGGTATSLTGSGTTYQLTVTPSGSAPVVVNLPAGSAQDAAGNQNTVAAPGTTAYVDSTSPTVNIVMPPSHDGSTPFDVTVTFSEDVTGLTPSDFTIAGGTPTTLSGGPKNYTLTVTPTGNNTVTVDLPADSAQDGGGNGNEAGSGGAGTTYVDQAPPVPTISGPANHDGSSPATYTVVFTEDVTGLDASDFNVGGGSVGALSGGPSSYSLVVTPTGNGDMTIALPAGSSQDSGGNGNAASNAVSTPYVDATPPVLTVSGPIDHDGSTPFQVTINADEPVTGLTIADLFVTNGTASALSGSGAGPYTVTITPDGPSDIAVAVLANAVQDSGGNPNAQSNTATPVYVDQSAPQVSVSAPASHDSSATFQATITFDEPVTGFGLPGITVANGTASNLSGGPSVYTVDITPTGELDATITVTSGAAQDATGNNSNASSPVLVPYVDSFAPTVVVSSPPSHNGSSPFVVTYTFSEDVTNFTLADAQPGATGATLSNLSGGPAVWTADATPTGNADATISLPAGAAQDAAGNLSDAGAPSTTSYVDSAGPLVSISSDPSHDGVVSEFVTITFTEDVTGFDISDLTIVGGTPGSLAGGPAIYTVPITPNGNADITIDIAAGAAQDAGGNDNEAATQATISYVDSTAPTVVVSTPAVSHGGTDDSASFVATFTFSENVDGFDLGDIAVTGGVATGISGTGSVYTATITPTGNADTTVSVPASSAQDDAGNGNTASNDLLVPYVDVTEPSVSLVCPGVHINVPFDVTATFSEPVTGFTAADVTVANGNVSSVSGSGTTYTISVTPTGGDVDISLAAGVAQDAAGNGNTASGTCTTGLGDVTQPTVVLSSPTTTHDGSAFQVTATFSEDVNPLLSGLISVTNGVVTNVSGGPTVYTFDVTPTVATSPVDIQVMAGATTDLSGNGNLDSNILNVSEPFAGVLTLNRLCHDGIAFNVLQNNISATVVFNRSVTDFDQSDIVVSGATVSNFVGAGDTYTFDLNETADADFTVSVLANAATDTLGNTSPAMPVQTVSYEAPPIVTLTGPSNHDGSPYQINYSITGGPFLATIKALGFFPPGRVSNLVPTDANNGTVTVTPIDADTSDEIYLVPSHIIHRSGGCDIYNPESNHLTVLPAQDWVTLISPIGTNLAVASGDLGGIPVSLSSTGSMTMITNNPVDMSTSSFTPSGLASQDNWRAGLWNRTATVHTIVFASPVVNPTLHFKWWGGFRRMVFDNIAIGNISVLSSDGAVPLTPSGPHTIADTVSREGSVQLIGTYSQIQLSGDMSQGSGSGSYYLQVSV